MAGEEPSLMDDFLEAASDTMDSAGAALESVAETVAEVSEAAVEAIGVENVDAAFKAMDEAVASTVEAVGADNIEAVKNVVNEALETVGLSDPESPESPDTPKDSASDIPSIDNSFTVQSESLSHVNDVNQETLEKFVNSDGVNKIIEVAMAGSDHTQAHDIANMRVIFDALDEETLAEATSLPLEEVQQIKTDFDEVASSKQFSVNCFAFAVGDLNNDPGDKPMPGEASGFDKIKTEDITSELIIEMSEADGLKAVGDAVPEQRTEGTYLVALYISEGHDMHWVRENPETGILEDKLGYEAANQRVSADGTPKTMDDIDGVYVGDGYVRAQLFEVPIGGIKVGADATIENKATVTVKAETAMDYDVIAKDSSVITDGFNASAQGNDVSVDNNLVASNDATYEVAPATQQMSI